MSQASTMSRPSALSRNDAHVLDALFDPESSLTSASSNPETETPAAHAHGDGNDKDKDEEDEIFRALQHEEARILRPLETAEPNDATIHSVIAALTDLVDAHAGHAPLYVNRAQARRMLLRTWPRVTTLDTATIVSTIDAILSDLARAIRLAGPARGSGSGGAEADVSSLSPWRRKALAAAHTHRGHLYNTLAACADVSCLPDGLRGVGATELLELASFDFRMGGRYGNQAAKQMAVRTNPYARMCGAIVKEAMRKEMMA